MDNKSSKIVTIIFIICLFAIGILTFIKSYSFIYAELKETKYIDLNKKIDSVVQEKIVGKRTWINFNGLVQKLMNVTIVRSTDGGNVYKLKNGQLIYNLAKQDMSAYIDNMIKLNTYLKTREINLLYTQLPFKIHDNSDMPPGTNEYGNENANELLAALNNESIDNIDLRPRMKNDFESYYFVTDHHWKPATALWAADEISNEISNKYGYPNNKKMNIENFNIETYEDWFLGSLGKKTGIYYAGADDFDVITPKFKTDFDFYADTAGGEIERKGNFKDVMFNFDMINKKDYFNLNPYAGYIGGDYKLNIIKNNSAPNDKKVLLLRDSYSCTLLPFMSLNFKEISAIDLRYYKKTSLIDYIEEYEPDLVILAYNPSAFSSAQFDFGI